MPQEVSAVVAAILSSGMSMAIPISLNRRSINRFCSSFVLRAAISVILSSSLMAVFGIRRNIGISGAITKCASSSKLIPAATDTSVCLLFSFSSRMTDSTNQGFTARMTTSAPVAASVLLRVVEMPGNSSFSFSSLPALGLDTMISESAIRLPFARPRAIEPPMFPAPIIAIFICASFLMYSYRQR